MHDYDPKETHPPKIEPSLDACPKCGNDEFFIELQVTGRIRENHRFDHILAYNGMMWDSVKLRPFKTVRCSACEAPIAKLMDT